MLIQRTPETRGVRTNIALVNDIRIGYLPGPPSRPAEPESSLNRFPHLQRGTSQPYRYQCPRLLNLSVGITKDETLIWFAGLVSSMRTCRARLCLELAEYYYL